MPRRVRVLVEGAIDHIYYRTTRREPVFLDHLVEERFPDVVRDVKQRDRFAILTRCLMSNHYHLFAAVDRSADQIRRWTSQASRRKAPTASSGSGCSTRRGDHQPITEA